MATSISDRELQSYIEKTAKKVVRTVDTKTLKAKIKSSIRQTDKVVSREKNAKPAKDATGSLENLDLMPDMSISVYKTHEIKPRISIVKDDEFFFPIAVGRNQNVDKKISKHKVKKLSPEARATKFADLEDAVVSDIEKRKRIKAKAAAILAEESEKEESDKLALAAEQQRKINMRAKIRKIVKSEEADQRREIKEDIEEDLGIKKTIKSTLAVVDISGGSTILDDYPGENSKSSAKKTRRLQEAEEDEEDSLLTEDYPLKGIDKTALKSIESMFGQRSDSIIELLDVGNSDGALSLIMKTLLSTLVDTMPAVEGHVRRSGGQKGVYQLTQLSSQLRETCADIQAYRDRSNLGNKVVERYLRPAFLDIAVQITRTWIELEAGAASKMSKEDMAKYQEDYLVPMKRGIADYLMKQYEDVSSSLVQSLN